MVYFFFSSLIMLHSEPPANIESNADVTSSKDAVFFWPIRCFNPLLLILFVVLLLFFNYYYYFHYFIISQRYIYFSAVSLT